MFHTKNVFLIVILILKTQYYNRSCPVVYCLETDVFPCPSVVVVQSLLLFHCIIIL